MRPENAVARRISQLDVGLNDWIADELADRGWEPMVRPYTGYGSVGWVRVLGRVLMTRDDGPSKSISQSRGWRNFVTAQRSGVEVTIWAGNKTATALADEGGVVDHLMESDLEPGWHEVVFRVGNGAPSRGAVRIVPEEPHTAILSDIDDTVLVTSLPRPLIAAWNTFVLNEHARRPVPGMAVLYERLCARYNSAPVYYLSTAAWNVCPTLTRFMGRNLYPAGPLLLTDWGPTPDRLFRSGSEHKRRSLERLAAELPNVQWILIGDDGQHDPSIYAEFAQKHPDKVRAVAIRHLTRGQQVLARGTPFDRAKVRWPEHIPQAQGIGGAELAAELTKVGVL